MRRSITIAVTSVVLLCGCANNTINQPTTAFSMTDTNRTAVQVAVSQVLKDPGSAQFQSLQSTLQGPTVMVCGYVNAKNSFGVYVGFQPFLAKLNPQTNYASVAEMASPDQYGYSSMRVRNQCTALGMQI